MKKLPFKILTVILSTIFVLSITHIIYVEYNNQMEKERFESQQKKLIENIRSESEKVKAQGNESKQQEEPKILQKYEELYNENNDLYGWITIEDTHIDYPVMQTVEDQNFYLNKNWNKEESKNGLLFIDDKVTSTSNNIIIYGHNMADDSMFGDLPEYKNQSYYEKHKYIKFDTLYEEATYEVISVSKTVAYYTLQEANEAEYYFYFHVNMNSEEEFNKYVSEAKKNAYFETNVSAEYGDQLLTLSTCDYWCEDARLLVIAKKIE